MREYRENGKRALVESALFLSLNGYAECMEITSIGCYNIFRKRKLRWWS